MNAINITSIAILGVLLGIAGPAYGQSEQGEKQDHPGQQQNKPDQHHAQQQRQANPQQHQPQHPEQRQNQDKHPQQAQQQQPAQNAQPQHAQQQNNRPPQRTQQQQRVEQAAWQQHRAKSWQSDHRTWQQRGGYNGYRIPNDRYLGHFGPNHGFRIYGRPFLVVGGYPRFQYSGYWFSMVDPWPEYWANDWYDTDDVYVTYIDNGYYLFNRRHPQTGIAINISL